MLQKKKSLLEKIVKKDYNNELEEVLEKKQFDENVKSTLLGILYKIEASYKDIETVKKDIQTKEEYVANIIEIIKNNCDSIEIIKMSDEQNKIPDKKTYIIDQENKKIIAYPIERKILYAISKIGKKEEIIKDEYFLINETISELINVGNSINMVEPLRDFNGYSWTTIPQEIESIDHNLIYQNLRILVGHEFLNKWIKNNEFIIDYFYLFKEKLENQYGKKNEEKMIELLSKISILLSIKFNKDKYEEISEIKEKVESELEKIKNKQEFIEKTTQKKIDISNQIKLIDETINDKNLLQEEYFKRNEQLPLEKKIFSMRILSKIMEDEKKEKLNELENLNKILNPQNFVKYKKELEEKDKYLKVLDSGDKDKLINELKIKLQKLFLNMLEINIKKAETKQEIEKIIYDFRYYSLLQYDYERKIKNVKELNTDIDKIAKKIIDKAIENKVIESLSSDNDTNYQILKNIFHVRIIRLEDSYLKITKEKDKYYLQIFDENIFEEKIEIQKPKELEIKLNKKRAIMSY
ncbi:unknown [Clostridium sp. CAG:389]|nr:unknown [Clostridium sp. CAG:389]